MHHYRQALVRMRQGDSDRDIAAARVMGRRMAARLRELAHQHGWLDAANAQPEDQAITAALGQPKRARSTVSTLEAHRERIQAWVEQGVGGVAMWAALKREHGYSGSYSAVRRMLVDVRGSQPVEATCRLHFDPADAAQVDFGAGPMLQHPDGTTRRTWAFVMTLCFSRHQYVELVWDQSALSWLGCHRRAFEWFGAVPARVIIDNAKCAITKASGQDDALTCHAVAPSYCLAKGVCWDIAPTASLWEHMKVAQLHGRRFATRREAMDEVIDWLGFYNSIRLHQALGYVSPLVFEQR